MDALAKPVPPPHPGESGDALGRIERAVNPFEEAGDSARELNPQA